MNNKNVTIEVIMAAYNNVVVMRLVLDGYLQQKDQDYSLCIADDGSTHEIAELVEEYKYKGINIRHVWHEDKGFRRATILNKSIASSRADYIVFTDNDCIPDGDFISDHKFWSEKGYMVSGRRVDLGEQISDSLLKGEISVSKLKNKFFLIKKSIYKELSRVEIALRPPMFICRIWSKKEKPLLGANMAVWRKDLLTVNGFDNEFVGYGCEEVDLERRLKLNGIMLKSMRGRGCLFHMYHPEKSVGKDTFELLKKKAQSNNVWAENGIK
jgi:glycosyltransferase involved in cell wall biosynthesis